MFDEKKYSIDIEGKEITVTTGKLARQADGAVTLSCGDTIVLTTAVAAKEPREGADFFPLTVDVEERMYAAAKIPGGFIKREGRPSEKSILTARLIDRPLRPSFPDGFVNDTQIITTILTVDQINPYDILSLNGASLALTISDIPFNGPIAAVRIGRVDGNWVVNPTLAQLEESDMDVVVAGTKDAVLMMEASAKEVSEADVIEATQIAKTNIAKLVEFQENIAKEIGREKRVPTLVQLDCEVVSKVKDLATDKLNEALRNKDKQERMNLVKEVEKEVLDAIVEGLAEDQVATWASEAKQAFSKLKKELVRKMIIEGERTDGRKSDEIRPITAQAGYLPRTRIHGSGLFTRGQTQVLTVITLGTVGEYQMLDGLGLEESKRYLHHYNFPPFSTGEAWPMRGPKRREIGHGSLAEKALVPVVPGEEDFPYTIRLVSDVLESNGSSSMASVCGSTLALMDAAVPIKAPVAGIAMGLVKEGDDVVVLSDIQGLEDSLGDMDFKVAGTKDGVTAIQMDIKASGLNKDVLTKALEQAKEGRLHILDIMEKEIAAPREEMSEFAPRVVTVKIHPDKIRDVIGTGGKVIKKIIEETGAAIDIEQDGTVFISSKDREAGEKAKDIVEKLTGDINSGEEFEGTVTKVTNFGAFVEILPGKEGLVHVSKLGKGFIKNVSDVVDVGDKIKVKVLETDRMGKISLAVVTEDN
ncbi:MAG: polyribonucleotide nucleotidyltransferase [Actinobacteria bacterium]|nr:MAG: polyribonucleotide nucleotidyltransferase [Actinomycetota bacterium]